MIAFSVTIGLAICTCSQIRSAPAPCPIKDSRDLGKVLNNADVLLRKDSGRHTRKLRTKEERPRVLVVPPVHLRPELDLFDEEWRM